VLNQDQQLEVAQHQTGNKSRVCDGASGDGINDVDANQIVKYQILSKDPNISYDEKEKAFNQAKIRILFDLYKLAYKLEDSHTANLVNDEVVAFVHSIPQVPSCTFIEIVYQKTKDGSPLRNASKTWSKTQLGRGWDSPKDFTKDFTTEISRPYGKNHEQPIDGVLRHHAVERPAGYYHDKKGSSLSTSRA
jgi:hypothetical protein